MYFNVINYILNLVLPFCLIFAYSLLMYGCKDSKETYNLDTMQTKEQANIENIHETKTQNNITTLSIEQIPKEVQDFSNKYNNFHNKDNKTKDTKEAKRLDKIFITLRKEYSHNNKAMEALGELSCLLPDCSATKYNDEYRYSNMSIQDSYNSILMDKNTHIFTYFDIMKHYSYLLTSMQTTSIDLQSQYPKTTPFQTLKFEWNNDRLEVILIPKAEICKPYIYTYKITFIQDSKDVIVKKQEERLSAFSYPSDLVSFVAKSCACARFHGYIANLTKGELKVANNTLLPNKAYCNDIETERAILWDKYMQDSRIIKILQHEQRLYPNNEIAN